MELLTLDMLDEGALVPLQKAMYRDLRAAARKLKNKPAWFVVVGDLVLKDKKKISLFVALPRETEARAWIDKLKSRKPKVLNMGMCALESKDGKSVQITINKMMGDRQAALKAARLAFRLDRIVQFSDAQEKAKESANKPAAPPAAANGAPGSHANDADQLRSYIDDSFAPMLRAAMAGVEGSELLSPEEIQEVISRVLA